MTRFPLSLRLAVLSGALAVLACTGPVAVDTRRSAELDVASYDGFELTVSSGEAAASSGEAPPLALLERGARGLILERGYIGADAASSALEIRLVAVSEFVVRRTWSADPGYNGYVEREREEAVLTLSAFDDARGVEVWRGESRVRLPEPGLVVGPSRETVWMEGLAELVEQLPRSAAD